MTTTSRWLTIFEGPDGAGKSTAAQAYAESVGARYVHFSSLPEVSDGLARLYVEAMLPALLGLQEVVLDRCWLSERPYGQVFRGGKDRLGRPAIRMLERLALRCSPVVVLCDPGWEAVERSFKSRQQDELLDNTDQLRQVHQAYLAPGTWLPTCLYDYTQHDELRLKTMISAARFRTSHLEHPLRAQTAGSTGATVLLVGESFGRVKNQDPLYQWPFASFSRLGCSWWLAERLDEADIGETQLLWANADMDLEPLLRLPGPERLVVALGQQASERLAKLKVGHVTMRHPQAWKRFNHNDPYPLIELLSQHLQGDHYA